MSKKKQPQDEEADVEAEYEAMMRTLSEGSEKHRDASKKKAKNEEDDLEAEYAALMNECKGEPEQAPEEEPEPPQESVDVNAADLTELQQENTQKEENAETPDDILAEGQPAEEAHQVEYADEKPSQPVEAIQAEPENQENKQSPKSEVQAKNSDPYSNLPIEMSKQEATYKDLVEDTQKQNGIYDDIPPALFEQPKPMFSPPTLIQSSSKASPAVQNQAQTAHEVAAPRLSEKQLPQKSIDNTPSPPIKEAIPQKPIGKPAAQPQPAKETINQKQAGKPVAQPQPTKETNVQKPVDKAAPKPQPTKDAIPQKAPASKQAAPKAVAKKPAAPKPEQQKPAKPQPLINDPNPSNEFSEVFSTFSDTFYSFLSLRGHKRESAFKEQISALLPVVIAGSASFSKGMTLKKPTEAAPDCRDYKSFCSSPIIQSSNQAAAKTLKAQIESEAADLLASARTVNSLGDTKTASLLVHYKKLLDATLLRQPLRAIQKAISFSMPVIDDSIPANELRVTLKEVKIKAAFPLDVVVIIPDKMDPQKGRNLVFRAFRNGASQTKSITEFNPTSKEEVVNLRKGASMVAIYSPGKKQPITSGSFSIQELFKENKSELSVALDGGATADIVLSCRRALLVKQEKLVKKIIHVNPIELFAQVAKKAESTAQPKVEPKAEAKEAEKPKNSGCEIYVPSEAELHMFWGHESLAYFVKMSDLKIKMCNQRRTAVPPEVAAMNQISKAELENLEKQFQEGSDPMNYVNQLKEGIERVKQMAKNAKGEVASSALENILAIMNGEMKEIMENLQGQ